MKMSQKSLYFKHHVKSSLAQHNLCSMLDDFEWLFLMCLKVLLEAYLVMEMEMPWRIKFLQLLHVLFDDSFYE